jgi:hypothetical protein
MTITKEELRDYPRRDRLAKIARHIEFINTCLGALPHFPANHEAIEGYLEQMRQACADMEKELLND